jgi:predicted Na+-dependent transporter
MARLFESFEFMDRGWDVRMLENSSVRSIFVYLLSMIFMLGMGAGVAFYAFFRDTRHPSPLAVALFVLYVLIALRHARLIYRRLDR